MKYQLIIEANSPEELEQKAQTLYSQKQLAVAQAGKLIAACRGKLGSSSKIQTIKVLRELFSMGLKEAKDFAEEYGGLDPWWRPTDFNDVVENHKRMLEVERKKNEDLNIIIDGLNEEIDSLRKEIDLKRDPYEDH